jgi:uncharacterized protein DUF992
MHQFVKLAVAAAAALMIAAPSSAQERVQVGTLTCDISGGFGFIIGSQKTLNCSFTPGYPGPIEFYAGTISKIGLDLGVTTGGVMVWTVYAPTSRIAGALAGSYGGATAEATVVGGVGANVLVGGNNRTVTLQPLSVQGQGGFNVAAGVAGIDLRWVR